MSDQSPKNLSERFFQACVLLLAGILALWVALQVLSRIWGWLLLIAGIALVLLLAVLAYRRWRDGGW